MISKDELVECTGIETFLNQDLMRQVQARKSIHVRAIIEGQHVVREEELAFISESYSCWAREGAWNHARGLLE